MSANPDRAPLPGFMSMQRRGLQCNERAPHYKQSNAPAHPGIVTDGFVDQQRQQETILGRESGNLMDQRWNRVIIPNQQRHFRLRGTWSTVSMTQGHSNSATRG